MAAPLLAALVLAAVTEAAPPEDPRVRLLAALAALEAQRREAVVIDGAAEAPRWIELAMPAGMPRLREVRSETLFVVPRATVLQVSNFAGTIAVQAWKRSDVRVISEHARRDRIAPRLENGTLTLCVQGPGGEPAFGDVSVLVPEWMALRLTSIESPINVEGVCAAVEAGSVRGDVVVRQSRGPLQLRSVEGLVRVLDAHGRVDAASVNNLVQLERVIGLIDAESINGDIRLSQVQSDAIDASSVNGSVDFSGPFRPRGRYRLASHRGNLRVGVPVGAGVDVSVATFNGAFQSGFPMQVVPRGNGRRFTFTLGGGGTSLELQSYQGLIQLLRDDRPHGPPRSPAPPATPPSREDER